MKNRYSLHMDVVSASAVRCWEFGYNPDVEELKAQNARAKRAACTHPHAYYRERDDGMAFWHCPDCDA